MWVLHSISVLQRQSLLSICVFYQCRSDALVDIMFLFLTMITDNKLVFFLLIVCFELYREILNVFFSIKSAVMFFMIMFSAVQIMIVSSLLILWQSITVRSDILVNFFICNLVDIFFYVDKMIHKFIVFFRNVCMMIIFLMNLILDADA